MVIKQLRKIQEEHGCLPREELAGLAERLQVPLSEIHGVASFYPSFRLEAPPDAEIRICRDLSCHLKGAPKVAAAFEKAAGELATENCRVSSCACLGRCDTPVAVSANDRIQTGVGTTRAPGLVKRLGQGGNAPNQRLPKTSKAYQVNPYPSESNYEALQAVIGQGDAEGVIGKLKASGLRGMGGAGFPAGLKWELVRNAPGKTKYVICNADESEPGTFKDRFLLQTFPELILEGMAIAAYCVGAKRGTLFVRHEYYREAKLLAKEINRARRIHALGSKILGSDFGFQLEVFESPGGYICGEETALLEVLEGKRAEPRNKPPFPGTAGLFGKPTLINNVETFAFVSAILQKGPEWFAGSGRNGAQGLKFFALSGDLARPGVVEAPLGITAEELIQEHGGGMARGAPLKAFLPGGASSGFLPASMAHTPLDFQPLAQAGSMLGTGAFVAVREGRPMLELALNLSRFFSSESCGKCVPCRVGTQKIVDMLERFRSGQGREEELALLDDIAEAMRDASICGLGQAAPNPVLSVVKHFRDEVLQELKRS